jgi:hypothetical protein
MYSQDYGVGTMEALRQIPFDQYNAFSKTLTNNNRFTYMVMLN